MGHCQANQHIHCGSLKGQEKEKGDELLFEETIVKIFPNLMKDVNINTKEVQ